MITKVTSENKGLYKALFEKASNALSLTGDETIDSLDKYFSVIKTLVDNHSETYGFLPLDEPTFDINADTRVITIPSDFKKNGISVKGDHYAETLFFTVNRYYDTTDLYDDHVRIIIQWEAPSGKKGVSLAVFKDVTVLASQNKMMFGWALTDDITNTSGNVKFSIRFYEIDGNNDLSYSLSTLTASAIINPALDYQFSNGELVDEIELFADDAQNLRNRLRNSVYVDPTDIPAEAVWILNLPAPSEDVLARIDLNASNEYAFIVEATSDQGVITYTWEWIPTGSADPRTPIGTVGDVYVVTEDIAYSGSKVYYHKVITNDVEAYEPFDFEADQAIPSGTNDPAVYEKKSGLTISHHEDNSPSITGEYYVIANNRVGLGTSMVESNHIIVPGPSELNVTAPAAAATPILLTGAANASGTATLRARATTDAEGDTITYTWGEVYQEGNEPEHLINTSSETKDRNVEVTFDISPVESAARATFDKTYGVEIKANRNGDSTDVQLFKYRVTDSAHTPNVTLSKVGTYANSENPVLLTAAVTNTDSIAFDDFVYEWYLYNPSDNTDPQVFSIEGDGESIGAGEITADAEHGYKSVFSAVAAGNYYCKVKTRVNGSESDYWIPTNEVQLLSVQSL